MPLLHAPLSVRGARIVDAPGNPVRLAGVNWGGAHRDGLVPAGPDKLHRDEIARRIVGWGFSHVRLTFALGTFVNNNGSVKTGLRTRHGWPPTRTWRAASDGRRQLQFDSQTGCDLRLWLSAVLISSRGPQCPCALDVP